MRSGRRRPGDTIAKGEFKACRLELMSNVRGRRVEYVITERGKVVAKLVPSDDEPADAFGTLAGSVLDHGDIVSPDPEAWGEDS